MPLIVQQKEAAELLGVSSRTLRDWQAARDENGFPDCSSGYETEAINAWRRDNQRKGSETSEAAKNIKLGTAAEKMKQARFDTRLKEMEVGKEEGTLLPRKAVEQSAAVILSSLGDWCEQLPDLIAQICPNKKSAEKVRTRLKSELDRRREQMADDLVSLGTDHQSDRIREICRLIDELHSNKLAAS